MNDEGVPTPEDSLPVGIYLVTTASNTRYRIDFDAGTATRYPDLEDDSDERQLRRDEEELPLHALTEFTIGYPMVLVLNLRGDGIPTIRTTTPVTAIEIIGRPSSP